MLNKEGGPPRSLTRKSLLHQLLGVQSVDSLHCQSLHGLPHLRRAALPKDVPSEGESGAHAVTGGGHIKAPSSQSDPV